MQDELDERGIEIDSVGISNLRYPATFTDGKLTHSGVADVRVSVTLPAARRGTHMSRMVEFAHEHVQTLDPRTLPVALKSAAAKFEASSVKLIVTMPIAIPVRAPISQRRSWQVHDLSIGARLNEDAGVYIDSAVTSVVTSLCPCSKAISDYGAHNQRSYVTLSVTGDSADPYPLSVVEAVEMVRSAGSCPVYPIVKRVDERAITMKAFDNPAFVEDIVREISQQCRGRRLAHRVEVANIESIHGHDAAAKLRWSPPDE